MMLFPGLHPLAALGLLAATAAKKTSGGSSVFLIFIVIIAGVYMLFIAPKRRKQRAQASQQRTFEVGDEVVTTGGIYGRVDSSEGDRVALDISEGVIIEVARTAIARRVEVTPDPSVTDPEGAEHSEAGVGAPAGEWQPPAENDASTNGAASASAEWADPWTSPPADGEKGAPGAGGSS